ncbi:hypothetical protein SAY86_027135 [Trapa natans]|uniref:Uncharacterized protein n=1 Tax=Trapa natans TaxID=22666 RepID=A0AAN7KSJ8_TRANT|nr:hypothetical protein SAY86_027135 [Trapa natans]
MFLPSYGRSEAEHLARLSSLDLVADHRITHYKSACGEEGMDQCEINKKVLGSKYLISGRVTSRVHGASEEGELLALVWKADEDDFIWKLAKTEFVPLLRLP